MTPWDLNWDLQGKLVASYERTSKNKYVVVNIFKRKSQEACWPKKNSKWFFLIPDRKSVV